MSDMCLKVCLTGYTHKQPVRKSQKYSQTHSTIRENLHEFINSLESAQPEQG